MRAILATLFAGVALHLVLMTSLVAFIDGRLGLDGLLLLQIANPLLAILIVVLLAGRRGVRRTGL